MGAETARDGASPVVAEVEVIFFNLSKKRGLVVGALGSGDGTRRVLLRGPVVRGEQPQATARRLLEEVAGVSTALHEPELVSARVGSHSEAAVPVLRLSYAVIGPVPSDSKEEWTYSEPVDSLERPLDRHVDAPDAVRAARRVVVRLLDERALAPALVPRPEKMAPRPDTPFTLVDLHWVYSSVIGAEWQADLANFRRRVERVEGLVERIDAPDFKEPLGVKRGRRPIWYTQGSAVPPIK